MAISSDMKANRELLGLRSLGQDANAKANTRSMESMRKRPRSLKEDAPHVDQVRARVTVIKANPS